MRRQVNIEYLKLNDSTSDKVKQMSERLAEQLGAEKRGVGYSPVTGNHSVSYIVPWDTTEEEIRGLLRNVPSTIRRIEIEKGFAGMGVVRPTKQEVA